MKPITPKIGLVSMEILLDELKNYAGGMGILAGGLLSTARDMKYPVSAFTLLYDKGYVKNEIRDGKVYFEEDPFDPEEYFIKIKRKMYIDLENGLRIWFRVWKHYLSDDVEVYFIDTNVRENDDFLRTLTSRVYIESSPEESLLKRILLGLGTLKIVDELGLDIKKYHLNESHCVFLSTKLFEMYGLKGTQDKIVFTTHTPLPHGHEVYDYSFVERFYKVPEEIKRMFPEKFHTTKVLFYLSGYKNCVSWKHWIITKRMFNIQDIDYITNGVHSKWISYPLRVLYDKYLPGWFENPERFVYAGIIPLNELEDAKSITKNKLINVVNSEAYTNAKFEKDIFTITLRRRITGYKRNDILFRDMKSLQKITSQYPIQVVVSGTLHPHDEGGKEILNHILEVMHNTSEVRVALLLKNGKYYEQLCVGGGDLFIHTPIPPYEACGTSWMRASLNAVPTLTSMDGGTLEGIIHNYNGWYFGRNLFDDETYDEEEDLKDFYGVLSSVVELYHHNKQEFLHVSRNALRTLAPLFSSRRALKEYIERAYEK